MGGRGHHKKDGPRTCRSCDKVFDTARGFPQHEKACSKAKALAEQSQKAYLEIQQEQSGQEGRKRKKRRLRRSLDEPAGMQHSTAPPFAEGSSGENLHDPLDYADHQASPSGGADAAGTGSTRAASPPPHNSAESTAPTPRREPEPLPAGQSPNINDVKVEYHPQSGRESCTYSFYNYANDQQSVVLEEGDPWKPFSSRDDYEFANIVLQAGMKQEQVDCLFDIIRRKCKNESDLTFGSYKDVEAAWNQAGSQYPGFKKDEVTVEYLKTDLTYEVLYRDTQELVKLMLEDPKLSPHFKWDARRTYKWDGQQWEQFWEPEPTSGSYMWDVQSQTPEGGTPLGIYLYADKNKLSSFGTQKGYPVIMRITNLDADVRHGPGLGGGHVVGFLPDVGDPAEHSGKTSWANHKRAVWHAAMEKIIKPLLPEDYDVDCGMTVKCGDHKTRCFYTFMNIFAGDYEEQACMCLLRGNNSNYPCPVCKVHLEDLSMLSQDHEERTVEEVQAAMSHRLAGARDEACAKLGIRPVKNVMWIWPRTDPFKASSFDELHYFGNGVFGYHCIKELKTRLKEYPAEGRDFKTLLDRGIMNVPRWPTLHHFEKGFTNISFTDGSKYDDLAKVMVHACHDVFPKDLCPREYTLMRLIRNYTICKNLGGLQVHTEQSLDELEKAILAFGDILEDYEQYAESDIKPKDWNVIKIHIQKHIRRDVELKGSLLSMSTKHSEKFHGPMRKNYLARTNFKNVMEQLAKWDHRFFVSEVIRENIEAWDKMIKEEEDRIAAQKKEDLPEGAGKHRPRARDLNQWEQIYLGAPDPVTTYGAFEHWHKDDVAYERFRIKLNNFLKVFLNDHANLEGSEWKDEPDDYRYTTKLSSKDELIPCRFLEVEYESFGTWETSQDKLRCNPDFHKKGERYDSVLFRETEDTFTFARLICIFICKTDGHRLPMALVQPYDGAIATSDGRRPVDWDFQFHRVKLAERSDSRVIPLRAVERGALLTEDPDHEDEYLVVDTVDTDMFLRIRKMHPEHFI